MKRTCEWLGSAGTKDWSDPGNWRYGRVPKEDDDVLCYGDIDISGTPCNVPMHCNNLILLAEPTPLW